jgi:hypothetical protein
MTVNEHDPEGVAVLDCEPLGYAAVYRVVPPNRGAVCTGTGNDGRNVCQSEVAIFDATTSALGTTEIDNVTGAAWGDHDSDGDLDLYLARESGEANKLFENDDGVFTDVTTGPLGHEPLTMGATWVDYDKDGDLDLYLANKGVGSAAANKMLQNDGGSFVDVTEGLGLGDTGESMTAAWEDYNRDGRVDVFVANAGSSNKLYRNDGESGFTDMLASLTGGWGVAWGDYDNDNDPDLYVTGRLYRNDAGDFTDVTTGPLVVVMGRGCDWGDYDNDGDLDLFVVVDSSLPAYTNKLLRNDGGDVFIDVTQSPLNDYGEGRAVAWADYDNDGDLDIYVTRYNQANRLFRNDGGGNFTDVDNSCLGNPRCQIGGGPCWEGASRTVTWGDYDEDGALDAFVGSTLATTVGDPQGSKLFRNAAGRGNWLHVKLKGYASSREGIGARVRVVSAVNGLSLRSQIREVSGGGYLSHNSLAVEFGLGVDVNADTVEVRWPRGAVSRLTGVAANQQIEVSEPVEDSAEDDQGLRPASTAEYRSHEVRPGSPIVYHLPQRSAVRISLYDVSGRLVRVLLRNAVQDRGNHTVLWDGLDARGLPVKSGVYLYRVQAGLHRDVGRLVYVK